MSLPHYLTNIKSAGVYRYVFDKSIVPESERDSIRLLVGYSERGRFNTPVYVETFDEFRKEFGPISRRMERKGIFFHRMAEQMLSDGNPILVLNLKPFSNETSKMITFGASDIRLNTGVGTPDQKLLSSAKVANTITYDANTKPNSIYDTNRFWKVVDNVMDIKAEESTDASKYMRIVQTGSAEDSVTIFMRPVHPSGYDVKISEWFSADSGVDMPPYFETIKDCYLSDFFAEIYVFRGDLTKKSLYTSEGSLGNLKRDGQWQAFCTFDESGNLSTNKDFVDAWGDPADALEALAGEETSNYIGRYQGILFPNFTDSAGSTISLDAVFNADNGLHKCVMGMDESLLDNIYDTTDSEEEIRNKIFEYCGASYQSREEGEGEDESKTLVYSTYEVPTANAIPGYYLAGYTYNTIEKSRKGRELIETCSGKQAIYDVLNYKGIFQALTNNVDIDYKYLVDSFQGYPGPTMKAQLASIVKTKFNALAILNFPPIQDCAVFVGAPGTTGGFDMKKVTNQSSGISLPSENQGASWCAFYTQLIFTESGVKHTIPSAGLVSNLFMLKRSLRQPYQIVAGPNWGHIEYTNLTGPDYNYARPDMDVLEPFGVNVIQYIPRKGVLIQGNQTAKQRPKSGLSKIHIRELVTYVQDEVEHMLRGYQWELNTSTLRANVETKCKQLLDLVQGNGGIYDYRVQCDDKNNTAETIDNELLIVDIDIEPARGSEKCVQTLTIHRTGGIQTAFGSNS